MTTLEQQCEEIRNQHHPLYDEQIETMWEYIIELKSKLAELSRDHNIKDRHLADVRSNLVQLREDHEKLMCEIAELRRPSDAREIAEIQRKDSVWTDESLDRAVDEGLGAMKDRRVLLNALAESQRECARLNAKGEKI